MPYLRKRNIVTSRHGICQGKVGMIMCLIETMELAEAYDTSTGRYTGTCAE